MRWRLKGAPGTAPSFQGDWAVIIISTNLTMALVTYTVASCPFDHMERAKAAVKRAQARGVLVQMTTVGAQQ